VHVGLCLTSGGPLTTIDSMVGASRMVAALALVVAATPALADPGLGAGLGDDQGDRFEGPPSMPRVGRTYSERIEDELTLLGDTIDGHLGQLTLDSVKFRVDGRARRAQLRLAGETKYLSMTIQSDVHFRRGVAEVAAVVDLRVASHSLRFELPDFQVAPQSYLGDRYVEVRVPIIRGTF
jgi:hypothetical protein